MQLKAPCPKCGREMKRAAYLPAANDLPAVESFRCEPCGEEITMETGTGGLSGWDTYPNGDIAVSPVTGWSTGLFMPGMTGGLTTPQVHASSLRGFSTQPFAADKPVGPLS